jgi:hypothetical protein
MDQPYEPPQDTREFLAQWNAATEAHLHAKLTDILRRLGARELPHEEVPLEIYEALAESVLRALQVASEPRATVHDAVDYLEASVAPE